MRVLLVVSDQHHHSLQNIGRGIPGLKIEHYTGPDDLTDFLRRHAGTYYAVATTDSPQYDSLHPSLRIHPGPKLMLQVYGHRSVPEGFTPVSKPITDGLRAVVSEFQ